MNLHLLTLNKKQAIRVSRWRFGVKFFSCQTYIYSQLLEKVIRVSRCRFGGINISPTNFTSTCFYSDFHAKQVDVHLAGAIILKSPLNAPNNYCQTYRCCCCRWFFLLHPSSLLPLPLPITSASTIIGSPTTPLHCCVRTLPVNLGNSIVFVYQ